MITLHIDNKEVSVEQGSTVLEAAKQLGIEIPTMCFYNKSFENHPSCMVCLVKNEQAGNFQPSCALPAFDGMRIVATSDELTELRKQAIDLLLSDHVGDCVAPCQTGCPAGMDIPKMNRLIAKGKFDEALQVVRKDIALPFVLGYICSAPCEKVCKRGNIDQAVSICQLKKFTANQALAEKVYTKASVEKANGKVAIIGAGVAGLTAAYHLLENGFECHLYEKAKKAGGTLLESISKGELPEQALQSEIEVIEAMGAKLSFDSNITKDKLSELQNNNDFVVWTAGENSLSDFDLKFDKNIPGKTNIDDFFVTGSAVKKQRMAIRVVAQAAELAKYLVSLKKSNLEQKPYVASKFGKLTKEEFTEYLKEGEKHQRFEHEDGKLYDFSEKEAIEEAKRCVHCDCRNIEDCKLREYAQDFNTNYQKLKLEERKTVKKHVYEDVLVFEPQKCIKCNTCTEITKLKGERYGFTSNGRGFTVEIQVPFGKKLEEAISIETIKECIKACPTSALSVP